MRKRILSVNNWTQWEKGQGLVEYALILVLVAIVVIVILATMGPAIGGVYCDIVIQLGSPCTGGHYYNSVGEATAACTSSDGHLDWTDEDAPDGYYSISCVGVDSAVIWKGYTLAGGG